MINFVEDTLSDSLRSKDPRRIVGNDEKSSGRSMNSVIVKIKMARANDAVRPTSTIQAGAGRTIIMMMAIRATASSTVGW